MERARACAKAAADRGRTVRTDEMGIEKGGASAWREECEGTSAKYTSADGVTAWKWRGRKLSVSRVGCWWTSGGRNTLKKVNKKLVSEGMSMRIVGQRNLRFVQSPMI